MDLTKGLIGHWSLAQKHLKSATVLADLTPNNYNGTITAGSSTGFVEDSHGNTNKAYNFAGDTSIALVGNSDDLFGNNCSIRVRFKFTSLSGTQYLFMSQRSAGSSFMSLVYSSGVLRAYYADNSATVDTVTVNATTNFQNETWYEVVMVRENTTNIKLYVNAVLEDSGTNGGQSPASFPVYIGSTNVPGSFFTGDIEIIEFYQRVLQQPEITRLYNYYN